MRKCHLNICPVGIATQDDVLTKKFSGQPGHVINYFFLMAEEIREIMADLGYRTMDEMIGQIQNLEPNISNMHYKSCGLDLVPLLTPALDLNPTAGIRNLKKQYHRLDKAKDHHIISVAQPALMNAQPVFIYDEINNLNRTFGTMLSYEVSKKYGKEGLPENTINIILKGHGGQSFAFTLAKGITIKIEGDCNDYCGKGLSGGNIAVYPSNEVISNGFVAEDNVIVGNVCLYGATSGKAFFRGKAGERFCVRNSGALAVVEGIGDHGAEYMTGGRLVVLGKTGRNFAAGMSGGIAYIFDPEANFPLMCNHDLVDLELVESMEEKEHLYSYIREHIDMTGSTVGKYILNDWDNILKKFVKVMPRDYKKILMKHENMKKDTP